MKILCLLVITVVGLLLVKADDESRIVGGQNAVKGQFPHHVSIRSVGRPTQLGGGSIIADRFVLTAAHILDRTTESNLRVVAGEVDNQVTGTQHLVDKVIIHRNYDGRYSNIAILRVAKPFQFSANVQAIQTPTADVPVNRENLASPATIVGWEQHKPSSETPNHPRILQWAHTTAISRAECSRLLSRGIGYGEVCTKDKPNTGACSLDAGGGLITQGAKPVLIGVLATVWNGCPSPLPIIHTRVFQYLRFIRETMDGEEN